MFVTFSTVFIWLAGLQPCVTLQVNISFSSPRICVLSIPSNWYQLKIDYLNLFNQSIHECQSRPVDLFYSIESESVESLRDLNARFFPLLARISHFNELAVTIVGPKGISVDFKIPNFKSDPYILIIFYQTDLQFLTNKGSKVLESTEGPIDTGPFSNRQPIKLRLFQGNRYHMNTSPLLFNKAHLSALSIHQIIDSIVKYNMLTFESTNKTLNSTVNELEIQGYGLRFDSSIFPLTVFGRTKTVHLSGIVNSFETRALIKSKVTKLILEIWRLRKFLHNSPKWLNEANKRETKSELLIKIDKPENHLSSAFAQDTSHLNWKEARVDAFDDSSFCVFYQVEQFSLNVKFSGQQIETQAAESCSCLLFWIVTNFEDHNVSCVNQAQLDRRCDFDKMAQSCSTETVEPLNYRTIYDTILDLEYFKYLADVWLVPLVSLLGIMANYLVIRTFQRIKRSPEYRRKKLTDKGRLMWEYTYFNSWFILFHAFVFLFGPLTTCIELNGIYCSPFILTGLFRPYYLFIENFLGNTFRLSANMSSTLFVLYRFGLNTDRLIRFRKVKPKTAVACLFVLSLSISVITLFVNDRFSLNELSIKSFSYMVQVEFKLLRSGTVLKILYFVNIILGTALFTLFNMLFDLRLFCMLRNQNTDRPKEEAEKRITKMVVLNGLFSFFFRLPEMVSALLLLMFAIDPSTFAFCIISNERHHSVCPILFSISRFLLTVSYLENLSLLYFFNPNFKKHFAFK
nr:G protein-coupled receptor [Proales similis]